tara:strand:+ start:37 stop:270 length:234 start_codon:yes stop_codon:yes gene_type:complete
MCSVISFFIIFFLFGVLSMSLLSLDMLAAFHAVAATVGNVGPGLGSVGATDNYAHLPAPASGCSLCLCCLDDWKFPP